MIPLDSIDGVASSLEAPNLTALEAFFGPTAVIFSNQQAAIQATLEILGSRESDLPVVLSIASTPDVVAAVLRSGASPFLLDIDATTLQMQPELLKEALSQLPADTVVLLDSLLGLDIDQRLLDLCEEVPTIGLPNRIPHKGLTDKDCLCSFSIFDMQSAFGEGALLVHRFSDEVRALKLVRSGMLGLGAGLSEAKSLQILEELKLDPTMEAARSSRRSVLTGYQDTTTHPEHKVCSLPVKDVARVIVHLHSNGIMSDKLIRPVHNLPTLQERWLEQPSYPVAESLGNTILALPTHKGVAGFEQDILRLIKEVD